MIGFRVTDITYDQEMLEGKIHSGSSRSLRRVGFSVLDTAKQSIVRGKGSSRPGTPPHNRTGALRNFIRYSVNPDAGTVVIGPEYLQRKSKYAVQALENGGLSLSWTNRPVQIQKRPFMNPALQAVVPVVPSIFEDSVY